MLRSFSSAIFFGTFFQLLVYPVLEIVTHNCVNDVGDVPSVEILDLSRLLWQRLSNLWILPGPVQHIGLRQPCKEGDVNVVNVFAHNQPSGATDDVPQVKDRHRLVGVQVGANLGGEEAEALSF